VTDLRLIGTSREEWRQRWTTIAQSLSDTGKSLHVEDAAFIRRMLREEQEASEQDVAAMRRYLLERTGTIEEVASETGYTASHLHALVRERMLEDVSDGRPVRVRYSDVWALRGVPLERQQLATAERPSATKHPKGHRPVVRADRVTTRIVTTASR
jgi:hypothetical protein